jgi:hypothetical protein
MIPSRKGTICAERRAGARAAVCWLLLALLAGLPADDAGAEHRPAAWAGRFYPAADGELRAWIDTLRSQAGSRVASPALLPEAGRLRALIMPHAGYRYSGLTAAHGALALAGSAPATVMLLGPDHRVGLRGVAVGRASSYETPLGSVVLSPLAERLLQQGPPFMVHAGAEREEHSLEVVLPFLQHGLPPFALLPLIVGQVEPRRLADTLEPLLDERALLVVSSDLSHFLDQEQALARDSQSIAAILALDEHALAHIDNSACGVMPIRALLTLASRHHWQPQLLHRSTSADAGGERQRVVGYAAIAFYGDPAMTTDPASALQLSPEQGQRLVRLARRTIAESLGQRPAQSDDALRESLFDTPRATFVTLTKAGALRGCIGSLAASQALREGVRDNALNAAFHDPRFRPLQADELETVAIEVSVLTEPQSLPYRDGDDLLTRLRPEVDGVIIRQGGRSATFLPQVWAQLPRPEEFLSHLCRKAGLPADAWRQGALQVQTYQVQCFHEER